MELKPQEDQASVEQQAAAESTPVRKSYAAPTLIEYGTLAELTRGTHGGDPTDIPFEGSSYT